MTEVRSPLQRAAEVLTYLPAYRRVTFVTPNHRLEGIARDMPWAANGDGRRYTVDGSEWFITADALERVGVTSVWIESFTLPIE